jgi:hypothetical protein
MMVTVLKNHLAVEQFMNEFLQISGKKAKGSFADKAQHCQSLKPAEIEPPVWNVLTAANQLRNKIAHTLDQAEIKVKMDELRAAYLAALTEEQALQRSALIILAKLGYFYSWMAIGRSHNFNSMTPAYSVHQGWRQYSVRAREHPVLRRGKSRISCDMMAGSLTPFQSSRPCLTVFLALHANLEDITNNGSGDEHNESGHVTDCV